jgi:DNA primase
MGRIPDHVVEEVRERAEIVQVVGRYVTLKKSGNRHWGLCPFHSEKTPSFQVHEDRQIYHCFGCGASGDVFGFRMLHDGLDFPDAVRTLARECGVEVPASTGASSGQVSQLYEVNDTALEYFRQSLRSPLGAPARRYLKGRGLSDELLNRFQVGYAPPGWDGLLKYLAAKGTSVQVAELAGLMSRRQTHEGHYDRFRGRVVFPIMEPSGHVVGFGGRALGSEDTPKYLNSPENPIYRKGRVLFGLPLALDAIRQHGRVVVVEGYFDLVALHRAGIEEGVAPCGTALTADHAHRLRRYTKEVILLFDGDEAGQRAAERALLLLLPEGLRVRAVFLPDGEDPDTFLAHHGAEALCACVDEAQPLLDKLMEERLRHTGEHAWSVADAAHAVAPLLRALPDPIERATYVRAVAQRLNVPEKALEGLLSRKSDMSTSDSRARETRETNGIPVDPAAHVLLATLTSYPELLPLLEGLDPEWLAESGDRELLERLGKALAEHGERALAHLLSPAAGEISEPIRAAISRIAMEARPADLRVAEQAIRDCIAKIGLRALDRKARALTARLESCKDPVELEALLQEKQQNLSERRELWSQAQHV